jgi:hypothetical protein
VARISLVKPDKARAVEDMLLMAARRGQIQEKVSEARLIELLEQVSEQTEKKTKVGKAMSMVGLAVMRRFRLEFAICRLACNLVCVVCFLQVTIQRRRGVLDDDW